MEAFSFFNRDCPFNQVRQHIKSYFSYLEQTLNEVRTTLYEEVDSKQQEWLDAIEAFKNTREIVNLKLQPNSSTYKTKQRVLKTLDLSSSLRPHVDIKWNNSVKLLDLTKDTQVAEVVYFIPDEEKGQENRQQFGKEINHSYHNIQITGKYDYRGNDPKANLFLQETSDLDLTPIRENKFNYNTAAITKSHSSNSLDTNLELYPPKIMNSPFTGFLSAKSRNTVSDSRYTPPMRHQNFSKSCDLDANCWNPEPAQCKADFELSYENIPTYNRFETRHISYSVPPSPTMETFPDKSLVNWKNQSSAEFGRIQFCDPKERDCLILNEYDVESSFMRQRQPTVVKRPKGIRKETNDKTIEEDRKTVNEIVQKFQSLEHQDRPSSVSESPFPSQRGRDKFSDV